MTIEEKLNLWVKLTGVNPDESKTTISISGALSEYDIKRMNNQLKEALTYDDTGMFAEAYLQKFFQTFLEKRETSLLDLVTKPELSSYIQDLRTLYVALQESHAAETIMEDARKAMDFYHLPSDQLDVFTIAELRTSADRCMNGKLRVLQFASGEPSQKGFQMSQDIFCFRDMNALLYAAASNRMDGVSLVYLPNENQATDSCFAFVIKNGENLYLLTDMPKYEHPGQNHMTRCPGRTMANRIDCNYFPYQTVAKIDTSDLWDSGRHGVSGKDLLEDCTKLGTFRDMDQQEAFWTVLMISMIRDRFYKTVPHYEISYAGAMIETPQIEQNHTLAIRNYFPTLELQDLPIQNDMEEGEARPWSKDYLISRYKDRIDPDAFNLIAGTDRFALADGRYTKERDFFHEKQHLLLAFNLNQCGTKQEIEQNQEYVERYNYSVQIQRLVNEDYQKKRQKVADNVQEMVTRKLRNLCLEHLQGKLVTAWSVWDPFEKVTENRKEDFSQQYTFDHWHELNNAYTSSNVYFRYGYDGISNKADMRCYFSGKKPGVVIRIIPSTMDALLRVCDCKKEELPVELQHWHTEEEYYGNPILERIDPLLWHVSDPFNKMRFEINILLSKKKYLVLCEEAGVKKNEFWKDIPPVCFREDQDGSCPGAYHYSYGNGKRLMSKCEKCKYKA